MKAHPVFARVYGALAALAEHGELGRLRSEVLAGAQGRLLVVGAGPGHDFAHLPPTVDEVVALEPEPTLLRWSARRAATSARSGDPARSGVPVHLVAGAGEQLPLPDDSVDAVLLALVLCSVSDPTRVLDEVRRVLRPGGRVHVLEHVRAPEGSLLGWIQDRSTPAWRRVAGGCHPNRRTRALLEAGGFDTSGVADAALTGVPLVRPHLRGVARPR